MVKRIITNKKLIIAIKLNIVRTIKINRIIIRCKYKLN